MRREREVLAHMQEYLRRQLELAFRSYDVYRWQAVLDAMRIIDHARLEVKP